MHSTPPTMCHAARWLAVGMSLILTHGSVTAQPSPTTAPTTQPNPEPYWLRVTASELNLRARPDANSTIIARIPRNSILRATGEKYNWHAIKPPAGAFSWVSAKYVQRETPTQGRVAVQTGNLRVRVGSLLAEDRSPEQADVQTLLPPDTPVQIIAAHGEWLKIVPPPVVRFYVHADYVARISDTVANRLGPTRLGPGPTKDQTAPPGDSQTATRAPQTTVDQHNLSGSWGRRLLAVETDIAVESRREALDQQWEPLIARLQPIADQSDEPAVARLAGAWLERLRTRVQNIELVREAERIQHRAARERAQQKRELERIRELREQATSRPYFTARGVLRSTRTPTTNPQRPRYKLVDALTNRLIAFLQPAPDKNLDWDTAIDQYVGVRGDRRFEPSLGAAVIRTTQLILLRQQEPTTQPTRPKP